MSNSKYVVALVYSSGSVPFLDEIMSAFGHVALIRVVYNKEGETNKAVAVVAQTAFDKMVQAGLSVPPRHRTEGQDRSNLTVVRYELREHEFPNEKQSNNLYVPTPKDLVDRRESTVKSTIEDKLNTLSECGLLTSGSWRINVLLQSRKSGTAGRGSYISFDNSVDDTQRAFVRLCMNDTYWGGLSNDRESLDTEDEFEDTDSDLVFRCTWARKQTPRQSPEGPAPTEDELREQRKIDQVNRIVKRAVPQPTVRTR